ncbi:minor capsid protein [Leuconostoc lactis]|uniref:minor capsid protein n=1 Tax=Leuconostoc lactis TaxID=1246 RepID=UPI000496C8AA|nr:minor capsid protein [Leuconostoc lactis]MCT8388333.1 capsid protein [Leuconostoc lactis]
MANTKITIDLSGVNKKISQKAFQRGQSAVANQALLDMSVYVPSRHGELRASGHATSNSVQWSTVYSRAQFYGTNGIVKFKKYTVKGTGKRWDTKAKKLHMDDWKRAFKKGAGL